MHKLYKDYYWKNGRPRGLEPSDDGCYRIIHDPYYKRISLERHHNKAFKEVIYDSALLDFRHIKPERQAAWQKVSLSQTESLIYDEDDRVVLKEVYHFDGDQCTQCQILSPHNVLIGTEFIEESEKERHVTLMDNNGHPVLIKRFGWSDEEREYTEPLDEIWEIKL